MTEWIPLISVAVGITVSSEQQGGIGCQQVGALPGEEPLVGHLLQARRQQHHQATGHILHPINTSANMMSPTHIYPPMHLNGHRDACQHDDLADARPEALAVGVEAESGLKVVV